MLADVELAIPDQAFSFSSSAFIRSSYFGESSGSDTSSNADDDSVLILVLDTLTLKSLLIEMLIESTLSLVETISFNDDTKLWSFVFNFGTALFGEKLPESGLMIVVLFGDVCVV